MNELVHIGLQVKKDDVKNFYIDVLNGKIEGSFTLSPADASLIFGMNKQMEVFWLDCSGFKMELFVNDDEFSSSCNHLCFSSEKAEEISQRALSNGYSFYIRKKYEKDTFFIKDNQGNLFEIKTK